MAEYVYISQAKLNRWPLPKPFGAAVGRRIGGEISAPPFGKLTLANGQEGAEQRATKDVETRLRMVQKEIEDSPGWARWISPDLVPGSWFRFGGPLVYGRVQPIGCEQRRTHDAAGVDARSDMVFFAGVVDDAIDLLLGGWAGHLLDERALHAPSARKGSRTEDFYELWDLQVSHEREGRNTIASRFLRLGRETSAGDYLTLAEIARWAFGTLDKQFPSYSQAPLAGTAQVLAVIPAGTYERPLVLATPLCVYRSLDPEDKPKDQSIDARQQPPARTRWWQRRKV